MIKVKSRCGGKFIGMISLSLLFMATCSNIVFSYIDPGTGTMVYSSVSSFVVAIFTLIGGFIVAYVFKPIRFFVYKLWTKVFSAKKQKK